MKYNEDIHPCYKSIGEKIEKMDRKTSGNLLEYIRMDKEQSVICRLAGSFDLYVRSYPTGYGGVIGKDQLTEEEIAFVRAQGELKFSIGAKTDV